MNGKCCPAGQLNCGGACVDTSSDTANCGGCGRACAVRLLCVSGLCVL
jgi:hypothetical protein